MQRHAPQGAMTPAQKKVTPAETVAFATMETELGGRQKLVSVLSAAQLPRDMNTVLGMIADPLHDHESLAQVCALSGVSLAKLLKVFQDAVKVRAHVVAHVRIAEQTPDLAAAVVADAVPGWKDCIDCMATGTVDVEKPDLDEDGNPVKPKRTHMETVACPACKGRRVVWHTPDHEVQKTALKIAGLLEQGKGTNIQVLQQNTQMNPGDTGNFDQMMEKLDGVLYGAGRDRLRRGSDEEFQDGEVAE